MTLHTSAPQLGSPCPLRKISHASLAVRALTLLALGSFAYPPIALTQSAAPPAASTPAPTPQPSILPTPQLDVVLSETKADPAIESILLKFLPNARPEPPRLPSYLYQKADLNGDGLPEVIVHAMGPGFCGVAGCLTLVLQSDRPLPRTQPYRVIAQIPLSQAPVVIEPNRTQGWSNLVVYGRDAVRRRLTFDGKTYADRWTLLDRKTLVEGTYLFGRRYRSYQTQPIILGSGGRIRTR